MVQLTPDDLQHFDEQGYVVVRGLLDPARDIAPVITEYDQLLDRLVEEWASAGHLEDRCEGLPFTQRLMQTVSQARQPYDLALDISLPQASITETTPMHHGPAVFGLLTTPVLLDAVEQFIGPEIYSNPVQHTRVKLPERTLPREAWTGLSARIDWHQDTGVLTPDADQSTILTVWFPITESNLENGCLCVVPGSHRRELVTHCQSQDPLTQGQVSIPRNLVEPQQVPLPMSPGDVLFMTSLTQHAGLPNHSQDQVRWSFDLRYQAIGEATGREWFPGFVARSQSNPDAVLRDPEQWASLWRTARSSLAAGENPRFNRWTNDSPYCA